MVAQAALRTRGRMAEKAVSLKDHCLYIHIHPSISLLALLRTPTLPSAITPSEQPKIPLRYHPKAIVSHAKLAFPSAQLGEEKT